MAAHLKIDEVKILNAVTQAPTPDSPRPVPYPDNVKPLAADRKVFRSVLARGLEEDIQFNHELVSYSLLPDRKSVTISFKNSVQATGSPLVGADGAWSRVRQQYLPNFVPVDTEARWLYGKTLLTPQLKAELHPDMLKGLILVSDLGQSVPMTVLTEPMMFDRTLEREAGVSLPEDYLYWVLGVRADKLETPAIGAKPSPAECASLSKRLVSHWHPSFRVLFVLQDESQTSLLRTGSMLPDLPNWTPSRVTIAGDAAYVVSPTAGMGASTALRDAGYYVLGGG
ncbi:MAG: hypothetical protein Q9157_002012 [Trypethelium eluteriae]